MDLNQLGFDFDQSGDEFIEQIRRAEAPRSLGRIGSFELLDEVGRGGQGVVFRARQEGSERIIALKRMVAGSFASTAVRLRFEREVEAMSALEHPNIVRVYGMDLVDGQPVLAMEWIDGIRITDWADGDGERVPRRDPTRILELFVRVCDAVQHAHSRGVLHRDLKPSNILIDDRDRPHILDFGLARLFTRADGTGEDSDPLTLSTDFLGTPSFAAPEMFHPESEIPDQRSDVYSLGVLLFELLTGHSPYGPTRDLTELVRAVETRDPPRPSGVDPRLGREIDVIVLKAMSKEPDLRFESVEELATDIRRYLIGQPILSSPPSSFYLLKKTVRRHRFGVAFVATVFLLSMAFAVVTLMQNRRITEQRDGAILARQQAEEEKRRSERILEFFLLDILQPLDPGSPRHTGGLDEILAAAPERVNQRFGSEPQVQAEVLRTLGELCRGQGDYERAEDLIRQAYEICDATEDVEPMDLAKCALSLARVLIPRQAREEATQYFRVAIDIIRENPDIDPSMLAIALNDLGLVLVQSGNLAEAERCTTEALEIQTRVMGEDHVHVGMSLSNLARIHDLSGRLDLAEETARRALDILTRALPPDHPILAQIDLRLGSVYSQRGQLEQASRHYQKALELHERTYGEDHPNLIVVRNEYGALLVRMGREKEGMELLERALRDQEKNLGADHPRVESMRRRLEQLRSESRDF